jgi:hypothetical protein
MLFIVCLYLNRSKESRVPNKLINYKSILLTDVVSCSLLNENIEIVYTNKVMEYANNTVEGTNMNAATNGQANSGDAGFSAVDSMSLKCKDAITAGKLHRAITTKY